MYKFAVFGNPIAHSLSPSIHAQFAQQTGLHIRYEKILAPVGAFAVKADEFIQQGADGFNVTVPFKLDAFAFANQHTLYAKTAGAVNTLKIDGTDLIGDNTDGIGLVHDLTKNLGITLNHKTILILGAGGATRGIVLPLLEHRPSCLMIANRTATKAMQLAQDFSHYGNIDGFGLEKIGNTTVDIIINATSASLNNAMPYIANRCANNAICYDLMYGKQTPFMQWAANNQAKMVVNGLGMLVEQAAASFEFWTGKIPDTAAVIKQLRR